MVNAFVFLPRAGRADEQYALAERAGRDARANAVDDANAFKTGNGGNAVRDAYAPETVTASEGLKVLTNMRTTTSPVRSSSGSGMSRITMVSMGPGVSAIAASTHLA